MRGPAATPYPQQPLPAPSQGAPPDQTLHERRRNVRASHASACTGSGPPPPAARTGWCGGTLRSASDPMRRRKSGHRCPAWPRTRRQCARRPIAIACVTDPVGRIVFSPDAGPGWAKPRRGRAQPVPATIDLHTVIRRTGTRRPRRTLGCADGTEISGGDGPAYPSGERQARKVRRLNMPVRRRLSRPEPMAAVDMPVRVWQNHREGPGSVPDRRSKPRGMRTRRR